MKKYLTLLLFTLQLLVSQSTLAQAAPEPEKKDGATAKVTQILKDAETEKLDRDGLNSLNIPVDGLVGPGEEDLGYAMLQYMLGGVTIEVYNKLFDKSTGGGSGEGVVTGTTLLLAIMSGIGLMMLYTVLFYVVVFGLLFSNVSGKPFGERWSTPHLAIRSILSLSLLQPMARYSGLNGGQVLILGAALLSMGFAGAVFRQINTAMLTAPIVSYNVANLDGLYMQLVDAHMCQASLQEYGVIKTTKWDEPEVVYEDTGFWAAVENVFWSEQADDIDTNEVRSQTYCVGPECVCGEFTVDMPLVEPIDAAKWDDIQLSDLYGDWITQYMMAEGAIKINDLVLNYLDPANSPLNSLNNVILQFARDSNKSKNIADIGSAAKELESSFKKEYDKNWSDFKTHGHNLFNGNLSVEQITKINEKMADKLSDTGFVTAGFAQFIWMQRQEKLNSVYSNVIESSFDTRKGPKYEGNEYLDILDIDNTLAETLSYPLQLQQQLVRNMSIRNQLPTDFSALMTAAAKGETEDSYTGVFFNDIGRGLQQTLLAIPRLGTSTFDTPDPVMEMKMMGDTIFSTLIYGGIAFKILEKIPVVKGATSGTKLLAKKAGNNSLFDSASILGTALFTALLSIAFAYSFIIPSIPFVMFTIGVAAYFAYLFAVLGGSTVWIASWALPDGHDVFGHGGAGWSLVATLMLKPIFMLIGLVLGIAIVKTMGFYINSTFLPSMLAMNSGVNPISVIGNMVLYATLMSVLVYKGGSLIFELGELMFSMIGVNDSHSGFFGGAQASQALTGLNTLAANQVAGTTKTAIGTMLRLRNNRN